MACEYLEIDEFGEAICHSNGETCPTEHVAGCSVEPYDCQGNCDHYDL